MLHPAASADSNQRNPPALFWYREGRLLVARRVAASDDDWTVSVGAEEVPPKLALPAGQAGAVAPIDQGPGASFTLSSRHGRWGAGTLVEDLGLTGDLQGTWLYWDWGRATCLAILVTDWSGARPASRLTVVAKDSRGRGIPGLPLDRAALDRGALELALSPWAQAQLAPAVELRSGTRPQRLTARFETEQREGIGRVLAVTVEGGGAAGRANGVRLFTLDYQGGGVEEERHLEWTEGRATAVLENIKTRDCVAIVAESDIVVEAEIVAGGGMPSARIAHPAVEFTGQAARESSWRPEAARETVEAAAACHDAKVLSMRRPCLAAGLRAAGLRGIVELSPSARYLEGLPASVAEAFLDAVQRLPGEAISELTRDGQSPAALLDAFLKRPDAVQSWGWYPRLLPMARKLGFLDTGARLSPQALAVHASRGDARVAAFLGDSGQAEAELWLAALGSGAAVESLIRIRAELGISAAADEIARTHRSIQFLAQPWINLLSAPLTPGSPALDAAVAVLRGAAAAARSGSTAAAVATAVRAVQELVGTLGAQILRLATEAWTPETVAGSLREIAGLLPADPGRGLALLQTLGQPEDGTRPRKETSVLGGSLDSADAGEAAQPLRVGQELLECHRDRLRAARDRIEHWSKSAAVLLVHAGDADGTGTNRMPPDRLETIARSTGLACALGTVRARITRTRSQLTEAAVHLASLHPNTADDALVTLARSLLARLEAAADAIAESEILPGIDAALAAWRKSVLHRLDGATRAGRQSAAKALQRLAILEAANEGDRDGLHACLEELKLALADDDARKAVWRQGLEALPGSLQDRLCVTVSMPVDAAADAVEQHGPKILAGLGTEAAALARTARDSLPFASRCFQAGDADELAARVELLDRLSRRASSGRWELPVGALSPQDSPRPLAATMLVSLERDQRTLDSCRDRMRHWSSALRREARGAARRIRSRLPAALGNAAGFALLRLVLHLSEAELPAFLRNEGLLLEVLLERARLGGEAVRRPALGELLRVSAGDSLVDALRRVDRETRRIGRMALDSEALERCTDGLRETAGRLQAAGWNPATLRQELLDRLDCGMARLRESAGGRLAGEEPPPSRDDSSPCARLAWLLGTLRRIRQARTGAPCGSGREEDTTRLRVLLAEHGLLVEGALP